MCGSDGMEIAVEVQVDVFHRPDLRVPAAGAATFDAEYRAHRRLPQAQHRLLANLAKALRQRDARGRLAFTGLGRRDGSDDDQLAVWARGEPVEDGEANFASILPQLLELIGQDAGVRGDLGDGAERGLVGDIER